MQIVYTPQAQEDAKKLAAADLQARTQRLLDLLQRDPFHTPPPFGKLPGDLEGVFFRRITIQHRLVYQVLTERHIVKILRMWV